MSILNGSIHSDVIASESMPYGAVLSEVFFHPYARCADVAVDEAASLACAVYAGGLSLYGLERPEAPRLLGSLEGLGASRQVELWNGHAFVSARPDGLYVVDIRDPARPALVAHLDALELATGVAVREGLLCVTCRHMGVELWDVRTPSKPRYVSHILAGEAQSAFLEGSTLYVGDWMNRRIQIIDVSDPAHPQTLSAFALDGFADGLFVRDGLCYAVAGHHAARMKNRRKYQDYTFIVPEMFADGYGCGHGMTIFDVSDPRDPEFLSEVKLPPMYVSGNDMWDVVVSGGRAYVCDTYNGLFVLDVSDPLAPAFLAHKRLAPMDGVPLAPPSIQRLCHPVTGIAPIRGHILAAGISTGLHLFACEGAEPARLSKVCFRMPDALPAFSLPSEAFRCSGQVHAVAFASDDALVACGDDGLYALQSEAPYAIRHHLPTAGIAHDVQCDGSLVYAAEGQQGLAVYQYRLDAGFSCLGRYRFEGNASARQVLPLPEMGMAAVQLDVSRIAILRVSPEGNIELIKALPSGGNLYHRHLCRAPYQAGFVGAMPLTTGICWVDVRGETPKLLPWALDRQSCPIEDGVAILQERILILRSRKYAVAASPEQTGALEREAFRSAEGGRLNGQPYACGKDGANEVILVLNRCHPVAEQWNLDPEGTLRFVRFLQLDGQPSYAVGHGKKLWIACGHAGLHVVEA